MTVQKIGFERMEHWFTQINWVNIDQFTDSSCLVLSGVHWFNLDGELTSWAANFLTGKPQYVHMEKKQCQSRSISGQPAGQCTIILILVWEYKVWLKLLHVNNSVVWLGTCSLKEDLLFTCAMLCRPPFMPDLVSTVILQSSVLTLFCFLWHWQNFEPFI